MSKVYPRKVSSLPLAVFLSTLLTVPVLSSCGLLWRSC